MRLVQISKESLSKHKPTLPHKTHNVTLFKSKNNCSPRKHLHSATIMQHKVIIKSCITHIFQVMNQAGKALIFLWNHSCFGFGTIGLQLYTLKENRGKEVLQTIAVRAETCNFASLSACSAAR